MKHGLTKHKWYPIWNSMIGRCYRPSQKSYKDYGGRGVKVCDEWKESPSAFFSWLQDSGYGNGGQIDRIDNDSNYTPDNCRVVTQKENCNNRRDTVKYEIGGESLTIAQMSEKYSIKYGTLYKRLKILGLDLEQALNLKLWYRAAAKEVSACQK